MENNAESQQNQQHPPEDDRPRKYKKSNRKIDWAPIEADYLTSSSPSPLYQLAIKHKVSATLVYRRAHTHGWKKRKAEMVERAMQKVQDATESTIVSKWKVQIGLWRALEMQVNALLKKTLDSTGTRIAKPLSPSDLASISTTLSFSLKAQKLIEGEASEIIETRNLHMHIAKLIQQIEGEGGDVIGVDAIPPPEGKIL
jgi:hypothetical protein